MAENVNQAADNFFNDNKEAAKKDFDKACDLYRGYVSKDETWEERKRRINMFRCG